jgi:5-oxopent-3-ene-1,2,5-tricarboxylate decarboxylase / 2-hydroxyhepta-2,4-diene-1,7-dioate isomerase
MHLAYLDDGGERRLGVVQKEGGYLDVTALLSAFGEITERGIGPVPQTPLEAAIESSRMEDLISEATETLTANGLPVSLYPSDTPLFAPIPRPNRILAIGRNYSEHAQELGNKVGEEPIVFLKASTSVIGPGAAIVVPDWVGRVDFEAELLVVIGKGGKNIAEADAMSHVVAYSVFNDITARERQRADQEKKHPWFRSKSMDTFGPLGPYLVTANEIPNPHALNISLTVNGETKQNDTTGNMVFPIPTLIAFLSKWFALEPGDVIATGTPSGVGPIKPGDVVTTIVEKVGVLENPVVDR